MTIPETIVVSRYRCPYCRRSWSGKKAATDHISRCWRNPSVRSCKTCVHRLEPYSEPEVGWFEDEGCAAGVQVPVVSEETGKKVLPLNCPSWKRNHEQHVIETVSSDARERGQR